jgi:signal transduction histidine kinase
MPSHLSTGGGGEDLSRRVQELENELTAGRRREDAIAEILRVIGRSPADLQSVFNAIAKSATQLCDAEDAGASIFRRDGDQLSLVAGYGPISFAEVGEFSLPVVPGTVNGRSILEARTVHVADLQSEDAEYPEGSETARKFGHRTTLAVPLLREGVAIGSISLRRTKTQLFTGPQVALLQTFAAPAVIAIENARLFESEQKRTRELTERTQELTDTLKYQTATSDVLDVISRSPSNLQPVLDVIVKTAVRLCQADFADFRLLRDGAYHLAATTADEGILRGRNPIIAGRGSVTGRAALEQRPVHVPDIRADPEHTYAPALNWRTALGVPLLRDGVAVGVIVLFKRIVKPFTQKQIALVGTFANQALIAIENTRLFEEVQARTRELTEALGQQTATADVLKVISRSALDLQRVLDALVESAARLCNAHDASIFQVVGDGLRLVAHHGEIPRSAPVGQLTRRLVRGFIVGRAVLDRRTIHLADAQSETSEYPEGSAIAKNLGFRTNLTVPLLGAGEAIGAITLRRSEVRPFTDRQIELLQTFADQAVIAIENARLFEEVQARTRELQESLEYQTATSDVLGVISHSPSQVQPVLDTIVATARRLCEADRATIMRLQDGNYRFAARDGRLALEFEKLLGDHPIAPGDRGTIAGRVALAKRTVHIEDVRQDPEYTAFTGFPDDPRRTLLGVPLLRDDEVIGVIVLSRFEVRPFSRRQIDLVTTFADQAVIAIENARLFDEVQARTHELGRSVEELEIASQHKSQFVANMSHELRTPLAAVLDYAELLREGIYGALPEKSLPILTRILSNGKHLLGLINTVLDISKIEAGQFKLNVGEFALGSIVETVMVATESLAATKKLGFKTEVAKGLPYGLGDEQRLTQVLLNLVGNAIKFTDVGEVRIAAGATNGHFTVSVSDTGPGIPPEECEWIFEKFRQVDSSNTRAKGGTGLGLAIAREIVEMHGGRIWVESTMGQGSTFRVELPVRAAVADGAA